MMNINKSTSSLSNPNISNGQTLTTNSFFLNQPSSSTTGQTMKVMSSNNNTSNNMNQFGPSFTTTSNTTTSVPNVLTNTTSATGIAASATSNSVAGLNQQPQLPFHSQHSIFSGVVPSSNPTTSGISNVTTPLEDTNMNSNSGFDFLSMNPFSNPNDPFQLGSSGTQTQGNQTTSGLNQSQGGFGNRERRLSSIFDIENSRDSLDGGIGLFGSNNVFNATNKEDSCFSFGDHALSDKKNDIGEYDNSLFSFMEQRRYSKVGETTLPLNTVNANTLIPQKTDQFPLPPLSSPLLGNVNNNNENEFKFPTRDLLDESSKLSFASAGKSLTCTSSTSQPQTQRNLSFNELYTNPFNYDSLNTNNQTTMQKLLNMQQIILNNQERIQQNSFIDPSLIKQAQAVQQQQPQPTEQLVWNSIMNAQRTNERFLAENIFNAQFNQNAFLNKENPLLEKHVPLNTIAVQSHSLNNNPRSSTDIGFMSHHPGFQFGSNSQKSIDIQKPTQSSQPAIVNNSSTSNSKNKKKRKAKEQASEKKKKIKSQGHSSESQLSNQEIILASSSQFEFDEKSQPKLIPEDSNAALLDNDSNDSSDSNQKKFCFRNLIVEKSSKKMKFVNSDIKEEGVNQGAWSEREHQAFLRGLKDLGYGKWREIADRYVKTRTRIQVASHSQKYHQRLERHAKKKKKLQKNTNTNQEQQSEEDMILQHDTIHSEDE